MKNVPYTLLLAILSFGLATDADAHLRYWHAHRVRVPRPRVIVRERVVVVREPAPRPPRQLVCSGDRMEEGNTIHSVPFRFTAWLVGERTIQDFSLRENGYEVSRGARLDGADSSLLPAAVGFSLPNNVVRFQPPAWVTLLVPTRFSTYAHFDATLKLETQKPSELTVQLACSIR